MSNKGPADKSDDIGAGIMKTYRHKRKSKIHIRIARILHRGFWLLTLLMALMIFRILSHGIPALWIGRAEKALSTGSLSAEIGNTTFSFRDGLRIEKARFFQKGEFEEAVLSLDGVTAKFCPRFCSSAGSWIKSVSVEKVKLTQIPNGDGNGPHPIMPFGPVLLSCEDADVFGTKMRDVSMSINSSGEYLDIDKLKTDLATPRSPSEPVEGEFTFGITDHSIRGAATGTITPGSLIPMLRGIGLSDIPEIIGWFDFVSGPASVRAKLDIGPQGGSNSVEVSVSADSCVFRDVAFMAVRGNLVASGTNGWQKVDVSKLSVERPEGSARASLLFDLASHGVYFSGTSSIDPKHLFKIIGLFSEDEMSVCSFGSSSKVTASGYYGFHKSKIPTSIDGTAKVQTARIFKTRVDNVDTDFVISNSRYLFPRISASLYDGTCRGSAVLHRDENKEIIFNADLSVRDAHVAPLASRIAQKEMSDDGVFSSTITLSGNLSTNLLSSLEGEGSCRVKKATIYKMPLFAGFTDFMARTVPGVEFLVSQNDLELDYTIGGNGMHFSKLQIEGAVFSIAGDGDYWFSDYVDVGVKVSLLRRKSLAGCAMRWVLLPVSKLFELEATGPINSTKWSPTTLKLRGRSKPTDEQKGLGNIRNESDAN